MIARWIFTVNAFLIAFNVVMVIGNGLLLRKMRVTHRQLDNATERLRLQMVAHRAQVLEGLRD